MRRWLFVWALFVVAIGIMLGVPSSPALADDTAVGGEGGDVFPIESTDIRMQSETVQAVCYRYFAEYRVDFKFVNEGPSQKVKLGFPFTSPGFGGRGNGPVAFRAWQDGRPLAVSVARAKSQQNLVDGEASGYYVHEAEFPRGETTITVSYLAEPTVSAGTRAAERAPGELVALGVTSWEAHYDYWLHTGGNWSGSIGKAVVRYQFADSFSGWGVDMERESLEGGGSVTSPRPYAVLAGGAHQWIFDDLEPTWDNDICLAFSQPQFFYSNTQGLSASNGAVCSLKEPLREMVTETGTTEPAGWAAIDGAPGTAYRIRAGKSEYLQIEVDGDRNLREIRILAGRNDGVDTFHKYGRPKTIKLTCSDGATSLLTLKDEPSLQKFAVSTQAEWVRLEVLDAYPGSGSADVYISEVDLGNQPAPSFLSFADLIEEEPATEAQQAPGALSPTTSGPSVDGAAVDSGLTWPVFAGIGAAVAVLLLVLLVASRRRASRR